MTTEKDIRQYLHLYIGCDANVLPSEYYESGQGKIVSIDLEGEVAIISNKSTKYCVEAAFHDVEPILRRLFDMTEEEEQEMVSTQDDVRLEGYPEIRLKADSGETFRWLLSKGFDLFGLIDAGLAIDKKTL